MNDELQGLPAAELAQMVRELRTTNNQLRANHHTRPVDSSHPSPQRPHDDHLRRSSLLTQLAIELRETLDPETIVTQALRVLGTNLIVANGSILLVSPAGTLELGVSLRDGAVQIIDQALAHSILEKGLAGWVIRHGSSVALADVSRDRRWLQFTEQHQTGSVIVLPIRQANAILGVLTVHRTIPNAFVSYDLLALEGVAAQIGVALNGAKHYKNERSRRDQALALLALSQFMSAERSYADVASMLQEKSRSVFGSDYGLLFVAEDDGLPLAIGLPETLRQPANVELARRAVGAARQAWESRQIVHFPPQELHGLTCIGMPLVHNGKAIGAFVLVHHEQEEGFSANTWSILTIFTHVIAANCASIQLVMQMRNQNHQLEALVEMRTQQVKNSRDALRAIFDSLPEGMLLIDADEKLVAANISFCYGLAGRHPRDLVSMAYTSVWRDLEQSARLMIRPTPSDEIPPSGVTVLHVTCLDASGHQRRLIIERMPIGDHGTPAEQYLESWRDE